MKVEKHRGETLTLAATGSIGFAQIRGIPPWANHLRVHAPSATLENILLAFAPKVAAVYHYDVSLLDEARWIDWTKEVTDRNTATTAVLNDLATGDRLYVGLTRRARGLAVDITNANGTSNTIACANSIADGGFATLSVTDGTDSGASLGQDGLITWTVPRGWAAVELDLGNGRKTAKLYWLRFSWDTALGSTTSVDQITGLANLTINSDGDDADGFDRILIRSNNDTQHPYEFELDDWMGGIELTSTSITSAANLNWYRVKELVLGKGIKNF